MLKSKLRCFKYAIIIFFVLVVLSTLDGIAQIKFTDVTDTAGIDHVFQVYEGMFGGGACVFDLNKDGYEDVYITSGKNDDQLYLNKGNGQFENIFEGSGLEFTRHFVTQGVGGADVNRDGWVDLFITTITSRDSVKVIPREVNLLFINNGDNTFTNRTSEYGLDELMSFSTGVNFGDFNIDGFPDIYVGNYFLDYTGPLTEISDATIVNATEIAEGYLLMNKNGKSFENVYHEYGMDHKGFGFGGLFTDFDNDRDQDLLIHHDFGYKATPNLFLKNEFDKANFVDVAVDKHMDLKINSMGTAIADINNDGLLDYFITNIKFNKMMVSQGIDQPYVDKLKELGMYFYTISWGANFADFDQDGDNDLFVSNGDLNPNVVPMVNYLFENNDHVFTEIAKQAGVNDYGLGRGSVVFDIENDGDLDILVINQVPVKEYPVESRTRLFRNDSNTGNWIKFGLVGKTSESQGIGSRIEVVVNGEKMIREVQGGESHLSQNSVFAHFGLGEAKLIDTVIVRWLGHNEPQVLTGVAANQLVTITEPEWKVPFFNIRNIISIAVVLVIVFGGIIAFRNTRRQ